MPNCRCSRPPGGLGRCPAGHTAVCRVVAGECQVSCHEPRELFGPAAGRLRKQGRSGAGSREPDGAVVARLLNVVRRTRGLSPGRLGPAEVSDLVEILGGRPVHVGDQEVRVTLPKDVKARVASFLSSLRAPPAAR